MEKDQLELMSAIKKAVDEHLHVAMSSNSPRFMQMVYVGGKTQFEEAIAAIIKKYDVKPLTTPIQ